jgi:hypothetical protein
MIEGSGYAGRAPSPSGSRCSFIRRLRRPRGRRQLRAKDVSMLPLAGSGYGEELLIPSWCGVCLRELPGRESSSLSLETARELSWRWRQVDCSPASPAKLPLRKGCKKKACEKDERCSSQSFRTCSSPPQGFQHYYPCGGNKFLYFVAAMGQLNL